MKTPRAASQTGKSGRLGLVFVLGLRSGLVRVRLRARSTPEPNPNQGAGRVDGPYAQKRLGGLVHIELLLQDVLESEVELPLPLPPTPYPYPYPLPLPLTLPLPPIPNP